MDLIQNIIRYFKDNDDGKKSDAPEGTCPVCWGHQQYDGKIRTLLKDKQIDVNNHKDSYMVIQDFMKNKIDGITIKEATISGCPTCAEEQSK